MSVISTTLETTEAYELITIEDDGKLDICFYNNSVKDLIVKINIISDTNSRYYNKVVPARMDNITLTLNVFKDDVVYLIPITGSKNKVINLDVRAVSFYTAQANVDSTEVTYTAGDGIDITNGVISNALTAGDNITINNGVISAVGGGSGNSNVDYIFHTEVDYNWGNISQKSISTKEITVLGAKVGDIVIVSTDLLSTSTLAFFKQAYVSADDTVTLIAANQHTNTASTGTCNISILVIHDKTNDIIEEPVESDSDADSDTDADTDTDTDSDSDSDVGTESIPE